MENIKKPKKQEITRRLERMRQPLGDWGLPPEAIDLMIEVELQKPDEEQDLSSGATSHAA